ncbi:hypothetical protein MTF66_30215 [Pseudoalteromonas sp. 2CM39R]|uniref:hypothetical protein n=1 Tax=Pseudoalteromonas sp. 2CM39R TaxID=2929856 RepID=UPI0020BF678D|nr:hypothetical protein [Pseudoalteromonas sp. 2CM39R]MCK8129323.1 hypothetical protein [Pseudoalteromonas sp. 2CM39R]
MENKSKPRANTAFLKGMRYSLSFFLIVLSCLYFFMVGLRAEEPIILINLLLGYAGIVFTAFFISFLVCYVGTKRGIEAGESADDKIFTRDGKLNINIFKKPLD